MTRFQLTHLRRFVADHYHDLPGFQEDRHGHNWEVEATVECESSDQERRFIGALDAWVKLVDYRLLNEQPSLAGQNPTAETLARWAFDFLEQHGLMPSRVMVREKANYWAACRRVTC